MNISSTTNLSTIQLNIIPLEFNQGLNLEPGAMHACKNVDMETRLNGSLWSAVNHYFLGGESFFINTYKATDKGAWVALEEEYSGQVASYQLASSETLYLQKSAYVASDTNIKIRTCFSGISSFFKGLGVWKIAASSPEGQTGKVFFGTKNGMIKAIKIDEKDGVVTVDNDSIIGYTDKLTLSIAKLGNVKTTLFSGEGLVNKVTGNGTVFVGTGITKEGKSNYIEKIISTAVDNLTGSKVNRATVTIFATFAILLKSRVFTNNEALNPLNNEMNEFIQKFLSSMGLTEEICMGFC